MKKIRLNKGYVALVDDEDFESLNKVHWFVKVRQHTAYALRWKWKKNKPTLVFMHREILGLKTGTKRVTDHLDGNGLNNQKSNLRVCTISQNLMNRKMMQRNKSGYKGVYWDKYHKKWRAELQYRKKNRFLGFYSNKKSAALAYNEGAKKYFGNFARLNEVKHER